MARRMSRLAVFVAAAGLWAQVGGVEAVLRALERKQFQEALRLLAPLVRSAPENPRLRTLEGMALNGLGRSGEALGCFREALRSAPEYLPALLGAAELEFRLRDPAAEARLNAVLRQQPANPTAHAMLGVLAYEKNDCATAVRHFDAAAMALEDNALALWQYGHCLMQLRRPEGAAAVFERLRALRPQDRAAVYNLALALYESGRAREAVAVLEPLLATERPDSDVMSLAAAALEAAGQTPRAVSLLQQAVRLYPAEERHYVDLAVICLEHDAPNLALEVLEAGLRSLPQSSRLYAMRGVVNGQLARFAQAESDFERAAQLEPEKGFGQVGLSVVLQRLGRDEEAATKLREYLRQDPRDAGANWMLAQVLVRSGTAPGTREFQEAREALERAVSSDPKLVPARTLLGKLHLQAGETEKAIRELEQAIELDPEDRTAVYQLMVALRAAGRQAELPKLLSRVRELIRKDAAQEQQTLRYRLVKAPTDPR
ncbi:MAG TPA: tetratricopeptide repeat protein [Bryobacteraceae bacterium]|nr:tetratricopeptide repeat protein [Bryobacteraceae bacterium]